MQALPMPAATRICGRLARQLRRLRPWYGRQWAAQPLPIVVANARVVAEPYGRAGARRMASLNRLEIHTVWSACTAVCKVLCKDAHQIRAAVGAPAGARVVRTAAVCLDAEFGDGRCPDGGLLCNDVAAMLCTPAGHGWSLSARVAAEPCTWAGARRVARCDSFEIQTAWSVCTAVRTVLCKDAHHLHAAADSGCNENAHLMCERSNYGLSWLQWKSWNCGDARVMDLLLGLMHR